MTIGRLIAACFTLCFMGNGSTLQAEAPPSLTWYTNLDQAIKTAKSESKPILLFFTGSDWCIWCQKIDKDIFENSDFIKETANKLVFVKLDFPRRTPLDPSTAQQNKTLQHKFAVRSFPTVIIIDAEGNPMGTTGYAKGGGKVFADQLMSMVSEYTAQHQAQKNGLAEKRL